MLREFLMPLPHIHCILRFSLCIFLLLIVGHCIPLGSVCLALRFILLKYDIWALLKIKCFLQQVVRDWLKTKANMRALRVWTIPEHLLLTILPWAFFSHKCYSWSSAGQEGRWAPPQPSTISHMVRVREELAVLNTVTNCLCLVPVLLWKCKRKLK